MRAPRHLILSAKPLTDKLLPYDFCYQRSQKRR